MRAVLSVLLLAALSSVSAPRGAFAQQAAPPSSAQRLASETQSVSQDGKEVELVWWIPPEYWRVALADKPNIAAEQLDRLVDVLSPYTMVAAAHGEIRARSLGVTSTRASATPESSHVTSGRSLPPSARGLAGQDCDDRALRSVARDRILPGRTANLSGAWKFCPWHGKELAVSQ